jgi:hypothetical protein
LGFSTGKNPQCLEAMNLSKQFLIIEKKKRLTSNRHLLLPEEYHIAFSCRSTMGERASAMFSGLRKKLNRFRLVPRISKFSLKRILNKRE